MFWSWLASFVSGPIIGGVIDGYKAKLAAGNTTERIAADLAQRELEVQQTEIQAQNQLKIAEIGHWYEPEKLAFYVVLVYFAKGILWDKVLALGTTDPLHGNLDTWAGMVMAFYFTKRGIENVVRIIKR